MRKYIGEYLKYASRVSDLYKTARKQQGTATRKRYFDEDGYEVSPSEWAELRMAGAPVELSWGSVKGHIGRFTPLVRRNKKGYRGYWLNPENPDNQGNTWDEDPEEIEEIEEIIGIC